MTTLPARARADLESDAVIVDADIVERIRAFPRRRTYLLPALHVVQHEYGWLPGAALEAVGAHLRVPKSEVYGIASSFPDFRLREPTPDVQTRVCVGAACRVAGGRYAAAEQDAAKQDAAERADCLFVCGVAPAAEIDGHAVSRQAQVMHVLGPKYSGDLVTVKVKHSDGKEETFADLKLTASLRAQALAYLGILPLRAWRSSSSTSP